MINCQLILSISLVLFSIVATSWWSFLTILQGFEFENYLRKDAALLIIDNIYMWTVCILFLFILSSFIAAFDLIIESEQLKILANLSFVCSFFPFALIFASQMKLAVGIFRYRK